MQPPDFWITLGRALAVHLVDRVWKIVEVEELYEGKVKGNNTKQKIEIKEMRSCAVSFPFHWQFCFKMKIKGSTGRISVRRSARELENSQLMPLTGAELLDMKKSGALSSLKDFSCISALFFL